MNGLPTTAKLRRGTGRDRKRPESTLRADNTVFDGTSRDVSAFEYLDERFDAAIVVGGLHHMVNNLPQSLARITAMVRPRGMILACEPNAGFFLNGIRKAWYKADAYFEQDTERAVSLEELKAGMAGKAAD